MTTHPDDWNFEVPIPIKLHNETGAPVACMLACDGSPIFVPWSQVNGAGIKFLMDGGAYLSSVVDASPKHRELVWWQRDADQFDKFVEDRISRLKTLFSEDSGIQVSEAMVSRIPRTYTDARKLLVRHSLQKGKKWRRKDSIRLYRQPAVLFAAVIESALHFKEERKRAFPSPAILLKRVKKLFPAKQSDEKVNLKKLRKSDGTFRDVFAFEPIRYAQQEVLRWILIAQHNFQTNDFSLPGRGGHHAAARYIGQKIECGTAPWWIVADVRNAFPSVTRRLANQVFDLDERILRYIAVPAMPLNKGSACSPHEKGKPTRKRALRPQLPQGGAHSSVLWSAIMDTICRRLPQKASVVVVCYADNIAIGAPTAELAKKAISELRAALMQLSQEAGLGPEGLSLHEQCLCFGKGRRERPPAYSSEHKMLVAHSVEFCGYRIYLDAMGEGIKFQPASKAIGRFDEKLREKLQDVPQDDLKLLWASALPKWLKWRSAFPLWRVNRTGAWEAERRVNFENILINRYFLKDLRS